MRVVIAGGGTAGHVFPAIAIGRALAARHGADVCFVGTDAGVESRLVPEAGLAFTAVRATPLRRELSLRAARAPLDAVRSIGSCMPLVAAADAVVGVGGYASAPAALAAWRARVPLVLHEQNAVPGLANRVLARGARSACLSFVESAELLPRRTRTVVTGNPVRRSILCVPADRAALRREAVDELALGPGRRTVVILGGSQGAVHLDEAAVGAMRRLVDHADLQMIVLTGPANLQPVADAVDRSAPLLVRPIAFLDRMELAYAAADLVVARAGASSIAEVAACGLPSILVPYPHATGHHQEANARALERAGAASIVPDGALDGDLLAERIVDALEDDGRLARMGERAATWARPDAAEAVADEVARATGGGADG
jgi:UDP-N-acetylglucosamine--N-acetylmuramyl-(pentapeptide) pyrophosphoryl-undecaprenol N-acetylglucosamine transferase